MSHKIRFIPMSLVILTLCCSSSAYMLPEPVAEGNLLIGSLILNIDGYDGKYLTILDDIEVAVIGQYAEHGELKFFRQWVITDDNGYFYIANVPDGEYAIKGFKVRLFGIEELKVINELDDPQRNYYEVTTENIFDFQGSLFDSKQYQRIINFKHNVFTVFQSGVVEVKRYDRLQQLKLATGDYMNSPPVPFYFAEHYAESAWLPYLNLLLK